MSMIRYTSHIYSNFNLYAVIIYILKDAIKDSNDNVLVDMDGPCPSACLPMNLDGYH